LVALVAVVATRVVFILLAWVAAWFFASDTQGQLGQGLLDLWARWDARHFFEIAEHGYESMTDNNVAFFPLYPLLVRAVMTLGASPVLAGMLVSAAASLVAFAYLHRLVEEETGPGSGTRAVFYLALFPTAVFLIAPYTESLFLAGAIPAFYYARRERWLLAGPGAALAMGARVAGLFLLFGLALEFIRQRNLSLTRLRDFATAILMGILPLLAYSAWLNVATGSPVAFIEAQRRGWFRQFTHPLDSLRLTLATWDNPETATNWMMTWRLEIVAAAVGLLLVGWALAKKEWGYAGFMGALIGALITSTWYFSIPRMLLTCFPAVIFLAAFTRGSETRHTLVLCTFAPLATLGVIIYTQGIWFF
jgi:Gpi18-like mannosyltransferase